MTQETLVGKYLPSYSTAKSVVGMILGRNQEARDDDRILIYEVFEYYRAQSMKPPSAETITRSRRAYNEKGLYLPSDDVLIRRRKRQIFFRDSAEKGLL